MLSTVPGISTHHAILRHGALSFCLAYGEDGDDGLDQAMGTKVERHTKIKPCVVKLRASYDSSFRLRNLIFARGHLSAGRSKLCLR